MARTLCSCARLIDQFWRTTCTFETSVQPIFLKSAVYFRLVCDDESVVAHDRVAGRS